MKLKIKQMKKYILIIAISFLFTNFMYSQSPYVDYALKYSTYNYSGSARFTGMSGAFGALGGDFSSISVNPAGLGVYRSSEFVFSPGITYDQTNSMYIDNMMSDNLYKFSLNNIGFVASYDLDDVDSRWVNVNFAIGYNKSNDFNSNVNINDVNIYSIMEEFIYRANDQNIWDPNYEELFWQSYLLDTVANYPDPVEYRSDITDTINSNPLGFLINQQKTIRTEGSTGEYTFAFGANYAHKLYVGVSIGVYRLDYQDYASHYEYETAATTDIDNFQSLRLNEVSSTIGNGTTVKVGAIYKPVDFLRIGASFHLPTFYELEETYYTSVQNGSGDIIRSDKSKYRYELTTPYRVNGSLGLQIGKLALIDIDYELVDYSSMKLDDDVNSQGVYDDNESIKDVYKSTHNIRVGAELKLNYLYLRGGYSYSTSPYAKETINSDNNVSGVSGGIGYRQNNLFIDFGFRQMNNKYNYAVLSGNPQLDIANVDRTQNNFVLTLGVKF